MTSRPVSMENEAYFNPYKGSRPSNDQFRYINAIEEGSTDLSTSLVASHCIPEKDWLHSVKIASGESLYLSLPSSAPIVGNYIASEYMNDVKPICTVIDSCGPEDSLPDSNEFDNSDDGLSATQTAISETLSDSDDQSGSGVDICIHPHFNTLPKQVEAMNKSILTSTREPRLLRYHCNIETASINNVDSGVRSPGLIDGSEPRSTVTFNVTNTAAPGMAILGHASNSVRQLRDPHHDQKREIDSICSINLGLNYTIYRWRLGSTITYNVNSGSFRSQELAAHASKCLGKAARKWNRGSVGVQFQKVADGEKAVFQLEYLTTDEGHRTRLAHSFMPGPQWSLQRLWVYELAFNKDACPSMVDIFCHELGHILGLRHEFSLEREKTCSSVQWGPRNPLSIMSYSKSLHVQETDISELKRFYEFRGQEYKGFDIIDLDPLYF